MIVCLAMRREGDFDAVNAWLTGCVIAICALRPECLRDEIVDAKRGFDVLTQVRLPS